MTSKKTVKQLGCFLGLCFGLTSLCMFAAHQIDEGMESAGAQALYEAACFMPAFSAVIVSIIMGREKFRTLGVFPHFEKAAKIYLAAVLSGFILSLTDQPVLALFFPDVVRFENVDAVELVFHVLLYTMVSAIYLFVSLGEEIGWLGFLFPRLEKLCGITLGIVVMGIFRGCWHIPLLLAMGVEDAGKALIQLVLNNIVLGAVLVFLTKKSGSILPAALVHSMTNTLPAVYDGVAVVNEALYAKNSGVIEIVSWIPSAAVGVFAYAALLAHDAISQKS